MSVGACTNLHACTHIIFIKCSFIAVGINCHYDPFVVLDALKIMKKALDKEGLGKIHLIAQPLAYMTPDAEIQGFIDLPEFPFGNKRSFVLNPL